MADNDVADSTDWLSTPLAALTAVESSMRCQVCKDFYETPMITSCSHTFCSLCIRRVLSNENKCPLCRAPEQEIKLRSNWSMEEAVEAFKKARPAALELARNAGMSSRSPKRKAEDINGSDEAASGSKRLRSSARISQRGSQAPSYAPEPEEEVVHVTDDDGDYAPEPGEPPKLFFRFLVHMLTSTDDGLVPCPSCNKRMKDWQVFKHLESCPGPAPQKKSPPTQFSQLASANRQHNRAMERLPALSYSMLKETALRKKLAELGISNSGPRTLLERRHREYITMWNANCDAARPKSRLDLLRQLDAWERTQGGRAPMTSRAVQNAAIIKDKDFNGSAWASQHNDSFKDLIANARKSMAAKQKAKEDEAPTAPQQKTVDTMIHREFAYLLDPPNAGPVPELPADSGVPAMYGGPTGVYTGLSEPTNGRVPEIYGGQTGVYTGLSGHTHGQVPDMYEGQPSIYTGHPVPTETPMAKHPETDPTSVNTQTQYSYRPPAFAQSGQVPESQDAIVEPPPELR